MPHSGQNETTGLDQRKRHCYRFALGFSKRQTWRCGLAVHARANRKSPQKRHPKNLMPLIQPIGKVPFCFTAFLIRFSVGHPSCLVPLRFANPFNGFFFLIATSITFSIMHRNYVAAVWTAILFSLALKKFVHTFFFDHFLVFNHAHAVTCAVMLV